jgi:hypothetical protein
MANIDNLQFTSYSNSTFPNADVYVNYLNDFVHKYKIDINFNKTINNIKCIRLDENDSSKIECKFYQMNDQMLNEYRCKYL